MANRLAQHRSPLAPTFLSAFRQSGLTYRDVAAAAGRSVSTVHSVLHGRSDPSTATAYALAVALGLTDLAGALAPAGQVIDEAA